MADSLDSPPSADESLLDAGYALFFEAVLNEPFLDLELFRAFDTWPNGRHRSEGTTT